MRKILRKEGLKRRTKCQLPKLAHRLRTGGPTSWEPCKLCSVTRPLKLHAKYICTLFQKINDGQWQELSLLFLASIGRARGASGERGASDLCVERHGRGE